MKYELGTNEGEDFLVSVTKSHAQSQEKRTLKNYHTHEHYEIININSNSKVTFFICGREYECNSNSVMLSPPGAPHYIVRSFAGVKRILINFRAEYIDIFKEFCGIDIDSIFKNSAVRFSDENMDILTDIAAEMTNEFKKDRKSPRLRLLLALFLDRISCPDSIIEPKGGSSLGRRIYEYIQANYFEAITIEMLCDVFMTNRNKICKSIKEESGMTFSELLHATRIKRACELLKNEKMSIGRISEKTGYSSLRYFSDVFKKHTGLSPSGYRKNVTRADDK